MDGWRPIKIRASAPGGSRDRKDIVMINDALLAKVSLRLTTLTYRSLEIRAPLVSKGSDLKLIYDGLDSVSHVMPYDRCYES